MKRILWLAAIAFCAVGSILADDNVRAAQTRLKDGGFYFGDINGNYGSETAAAVTRYQIRNGLQISGQLDAATAKSLGVANVASTQGAAQPAQAESETWRRLRKADKQFLARQNAPASVPPSPARAVTAAPAPVDSGYDATLVLSRERLRDYVAAFVLAGLDPEIGAELEFFADQVNYYEDGLVPHEKIRRDLQTYAQRWPERRFWLAGEVKIEPQADSRVRVDFPLRFDLKNGRRHSAGKVMKSLLLEVTADDLQIVAVNEGKIR